MPKFFTKDGWLTPYALACGYIHRTDNAGNKDVVLKRLECDDAVYSVIVYTKGEGRTRWDDFRSISEARREYKREVGTLRHRFEANPEVSRSVIV